MYVNKNSVFEFIQNENFESLKLKCENEEFGIRLIDAEPKLFMLVNMGETAESDLQIQSNGLIFEKESGKLVCNNQNIFKKISKDEFSECLNKNENFNLEYVEDGTTLRLYFKETQWVTATNKCSDASKSFWSSSKSFDEMFWELFDEKLLKNLDKKNTYIFILKHRLNQRVIFHHKSELIFVSALSNVNGFENFNYFKNNEFRRVNKIPTKFNIKKEYNGKVVLCSSEKYVPTDEKLEELENLKDDVSFYYFNNKFLSSLNNIENYSTNNKRGVLVKVFDKENSTYKAYNIDFDKYNEIASIRGNSKTIQERYVELALSVENCEKEDQDSIRVSTEKLINKLENHYRQKNYSSENLKALYKKVYSLYNKTHKKHEFTIEKDNLYYKTLKQLHAIYYSKNKIQDDAEVDEKGDEIVKRIPLKYEDIVIHINKLSPNTIVQLMNIKTFYVPLAFINVPINEFLHQNESIGAFKSIKITPVKKLKEECRGSFLLTVENVQLFTDDLNGETVIFDDFYIPGYMKTKVNIKLTGKNNLSQDDLIRFDIVYVNFSKEYLETLKYQKIEQVGKFEIEYKDIYKRNKANIIEHSIEKVYKECDILIQNKSIRKTIRE
jgi:hypothetical protein